MSTRQIGIRNRNHQVHQEKHFGSRSRDLWILVGRFKISIRRIHVITKGPSPYLFIINLQRSFIPQINGVPAYDVWEGLSIDIKRIFVRQIAGHLQDLFSIRFEQGGSLYSTPSTNEFTVGKIVATPFYRALDGVVRIPEGMERTDIECRKIPFLVGPT